MTEHDENTFTPSDEQPSAASTPAENSAENSAENANGCTYHSGRIEDWNRPEGDTPSGSASAPYGEPSRPSEPSKPSGYGVHPNGEYRYQYENYANIPQPTPPRKKVSSGVKVFAVIVSMLLVITLALLMGFILSRQEEIPTQSVSRENLPDAESEPESDPALAESSAASREEIEVPELNLTSHPVEDTIISSDGKLTTTQVYKKVRPSVVGILNYSSDNPLTASSSGSGIILSEDGYILTNAHVIDGAAGLVVVLDNDEEYAATLIGQDTSTDLAVVKIDAENLTAAELGDSDQLQVGEKVIAIGNPAGLNLAGSTSQGIVSGLERTISVTLDNGQSISMEVIQTDAAVNPGNSGGPLINEYGQVIGINSSKLSSSDYDGIGFAIPISNALPIVEDLIQYGYVTGRVKLGITYYPISEVVGAMSGYTPGLLVYSVDPTMDIYAKGLRAGDIITEIDGTAVSSTAAIKSILDGKSPGDTIAVTFVRTGSSGSSTYTVSVLLAEDNGQTDTSSYSTESGVTEDDDTSSDPKI